MTLSPAQAWSELQEGNARFIKDEARHPHQNAERRQELAHIQSPIVTVFGCSDSRLAAEIIFDLGLGDAFVVRNAGQVVNEDALGSIEYGVGPLQVPLLLVLGHDECGAVRASIDSQAADASPLPAHIAHLIEPIAPAVYAAAGVTSNTPIDTDSVDAAEVGKLHLRTTVTELLKHSEIISDAVAKGTLAIVSANYRLSEGRVVADTVVGLD